MNYVKRKNRIENKIKQWEKEKELIIIEQDLKEDIENTKNRKKKQKKIQRKKLAMSKFLMLFLFISCSVIEAFTLYATIKGMNMGNQDFGPLQSLIAAIVAQTVGFAIYSLKSMKENTTGGIVYETTMLNYQTQENDNNQEGQG